MTDFNQNVDQAKDLLNLEQKDMAKLPSMLNVLTILTYIGCGLGVISVIINYFAAGAVYNTSKDPNLNRLFEGMSETAKKQYDNRTWILLIGLAGIVLCFLGAMQMRNLKKQGYIFYVIGELLPVLSIALFVSFGSLFMGLSMAIGFIFPVLFIILYATQIKYLVK